MTTERASAAAPNDFRYSIRFGFRSMRWRAGIAYLVIFLLVDFVLAYSTEELASYELVELALIGAAAAVLAIRRRVDRATASAVVVALVAAGVIGTWSLPPTNAASGYDAWHFGAITLIALGLAVRGHRVAAWIAYAGMSAVAIAWSISTHQGAFMGVNLVDRHFATLLVGTSFAVALDRFGRRERAFVAMEHRERAADRAADVSRIARHMAVEQVLDHAGPMLRAIADGHVFTDADRRELLVVEGAVRDQIRTPALLTPRLKESVASARRRGVSVLLLDESVEPTPTAIERATTWLASRLDGVPAEGFVGRVRGTGDDLRVTAVAGDDQASM